MITVHTRAELRKLLKAARQEGKVIGLVPTMGNLHAGHIQLVHEARKRSDIVVTSIFVNPMQFGANEDLDAYPRTLGADCEQLAAAGNDIVFAPNVPEVYPHGLDGQTQVSVPGVSEGHCGDSRPGHFTGVATVVSMLFNMVQPDLACFGEKDFQQLAVIRKLVRDLFIPVEVIGVATVRAEDGLALSSRNGYLTADERAIAPVLFRTLSETAEKLRNGERDYGALSHDASMALEKAGLKPDYFNIVSSTTLTIPEQDEQEFTILAAAFLGKTRLIDNLTVSR